MFRLPGHWEILLVVLLVALVLFGTRLPSIARSLGQSLTSFKRGLRDVDIRDNVSDAVNDDRGLA